MLADLESPETDLEGRASDWGQYFHSSLVDQEYVH
jgi:hypothetical protein